MKNFKKLFTILAIMLISLSGMLFGCGDKYAGWAIKVSLESDVIELFLGEDLDEETQPSAISFNVEVLGADANSSAIRYNKNGSNAFNVLLQKQENTNKTKVTISAQNLSENATLTLLTEEGNKSKDIVVKITCPIKGMQQNTETNYKPFAVVGESTKINTAKAIDFLPKTPMATNQRDVVYELATAVNGVEVLADGTIIVDEEVEEDLTVIVTATSVSDPSISLDIDVDIIKPIDDILVQYENEDIQEDDVLQFSTNMIEESYKIITINPSNKNNAYSLNLSFVDNNNNAIDGFVIEKIDAETFGITATKIVNAKLKIVASLVDYEYSSNAKYINLKAVETPSIVTFSNRQNSNNVVIYNVYQNGLGEMFTVNVGGPSAYDHRFVIQLDRDVLDKVTIYTGRRDSYGNLIKHNPYYEGALPDDYDILQNGSILYITANQNALTSEDGESIQLSFVAYASMGLKSNVVKNNLTLNLKQGVSVIETGTYLHDDELLVPIKQTQDEDGTELIIKINSTEYTDCIATEFDSDGLLLNRTKIAYEESVVEYGKRQFKFMLWGAKEGLYVVRFTSQNNQLIDVKVRVFTKIDAVSITTSSIAQNADLAKVEYSEDSDIPTLDGGSIILRNGGEAQLNINTYYHGKLQNCYTNITYSYDRDAETNAEVVRIDRSNNILGYGVGKTIVIVMVEVYDNAFEGTNKKQFNLSFEVSVETLLLSASINSKSVTIYTQKTLSDYVGSNGKTDKQKYGEFEFSITINPNKTILPNNSIVLRPSGSGINYLDIIQNFDYTSNIYKVKISCEELPEMENENSAKLTFTLTQYQRVIVLSAEITIKNAVKTTNLINIKKVQDDVITTVPKQSYVLPIVDNGKISYDPASYLYLYFDSRNIAPLTHFSLQSEIYPKTVLNPNLVYIVETTEEYQDVLSINNDIITVVNPGFTKLYICSQDSYDASNGNMNNPEAYAVKTMIVVKVADGSSKFTALDIANENDLIAINNNVESLQKFYRVTKNIVVIQSGFTPIGYINGKMHSFEGNIDGILSNEFGETVNATISGISFNQLFIDSKINYAGLIGIIGENAVIENLDLQIASVQINNIYNVEQGFDAYTVIGGLSAINNGTVQNVNVNFVNNSKDVLKDVNILDELTALYFGGIAGVNNSYIYKAFVEGYVNIVKRTSETKLYVGGLVGENNAEIDGGTTFFNQVELNDKYNSTITINISQSLLLRQQHAIGGVVGKNSINATINNVSFDGYVKAINNVGGVAGVSNSNISNAFSSGVIEGTENVGGLIGQSSADNQITVANSSVNMFDTLNAVKTAITGSKNVGGLIGYAQNTNLQNAYVRSYISSDKQNFDGDMLVLDATEQNYVGGAVGYANNVKLSKVYSIISINANGAMVGGLVGYAKNANLTNTFERNNMLTGSQLTGLAVGINEGTSTINYFYSSNVGSYYTGDTISTSNCVDNDNIVDVHNWQTLTESSNKSTWAQNYDWYLSNNSVYPYLIFGNNEILSIEAPTEISLTKKSSEQLVQVDGYEDVYVLFKYNNNPISFSNLFTVNIKPDDTILNVSKDYNIYSSDPNVIQISGRTNATYKIKPVSTGKSVITVYSKLNAQIKKEITIYVIYVVKDFRLPQPLGVIVNDTVELKPTMATNYANNNNYFISFTNTHNNIIYINNSNSAELSFRNNEKIFVSAKKSGKYPIDYSLYTYIDINGEQVKITIKNYTNGSLSNAQGEIDIRAVYGIKDFICDVTKLETGLNDLAYITYILTGDDLRYVVNGEETTYSLPKFTWEIKELSNDILSVYKPWDIKLSYLKVYYGDADITLHATLKQNSQNSSLDDYDFDNVIRDDDEIIKIELLLVVKINTQNAIRCFDYIDTLELPETDYLKLSSAIKATATIYDEVVELVSESRAKQELEATPELVIKRQKIDNLTLDFYTNAEKNGDVYEVNETPSQIITSGREGILKIHVAPLNADIKEVTVTYSNASNYNLSMQQMLFYNVIDDGTNKSKYIERKPYAIAVQNGIMLYNESNYIDNNQPFVFDGYLYISCLIPSSVPSGQVFNIYVSALCSNQYKYTTSTSLVSKLPSQLSINYNFNGQIVDDYAYIAQNNEYEFYVDFIELIDVYNENDFKPENVFVRNSDTTGLTIENVKTKDNKIKVDLPTSSKPFYRVYYTIKSTGLGDIKLTAQKEKIENNVKTIVKSGEFTFNCVKYVITELNIVNGGNNTINVKQSSPIQMQVELTFDYNGQNGVTLKKSQNNSVEDVQNIANEIQSLQNHISRNTGYWFGMKIGAYYYEKLVGDGNYANYNVKNISYNDGNQIDDIKSFVIGVKNINTTARLYCEVPVYYLADTGTDMIANHFSASIGENNIGLNKKKVGSNTIYVQYLRQMITLNLTSDVSSEHPMPITTQVEFMNMVSGVDGVNYYALDNNIDLYNYEPRSLQNINFNGNMHTITIHNFKVATTQNDVTTYNTRFALFDTIDTNSIVKNLNINYTGIVDTNDADYNKMIASVDTTTMDMQISGIASFDFAGVCIDNSGVIYNTSVNSLSTLQFKNKISVPTHIAGVAVNNNGYISYSQSNLSTITNCGHISGFVTNNSKKISNCKVIINDRIENTLTTNDNSLTAGFVVKNSGTIFGSYISTAQGVADDDSAIVKSNSNVAGFVNTNSGSISNSYSNVKIVSDMRSSGFIYDNSGSIESCYSSCKIEENSSVHTPFTATNNNGSFNNSGDIKDCYYIGKYDVIYTEHEATEDVKHIDTDKAVEKQSFAKFVFNDSEEKDDYLLKPTGIWRMNGVPKLVDADLNIYHQEKYVSIAYSNNSSYFNWEFVDGTPRYGELCGKNINPRIIYDINTWNNIIIDDNKNDYFVLVKDIVGSNIDAPKTTSIDFGGVLLGSNMDFTSLNLRAEAENKNKTYGLFKSVVRNNLVNDPRKDKLPQQTIVKDINFTVKQLVASNANCIGTLAGYIDDANIFNIKIDATDAVAQAKNMVGVLAGILNDSKVVKIDITGSVNAGYRDSAQTIYNYSPDNNDLDILVGGNTETEVLYSYAGCLAGALLGETTVNYVNITGENKVIGYYTGLAAGLIGCGAKLINVGVKVEKEQYERAFCMAGGLVGENRGTIDRCFVENIEQEKIDSNVSNKLKDVKNYRNVNFFVGTPYFIGGLVGFNNGGTITNSYSKLDVRINNYVTKASGGLVGIDVGGKIDYCYATGSVTNRYIIGGLIGVVTNKTTLLGYYTKTTQDEDAITYVLKNNDLFASYYDLDENNDYKYKIISKARGCYIAGKINNCDKDNDVEESKIVIENTLTSNKWLLDADEYGLTDIDYLLSANSGFIVGSFIHKENDNSISLKEAMINNLDDIMYYDYGDEELVIKENYNYVNTQVLKGSPKTTIKNIKLSDILKSVIDYDVNGETNDEYYKQIDSDIKYNLLNAIKYASIGAYSDVIDISFNKKPKIEFAQCLVNDVLISFENILNIDETMYETYVAISVNEDNFDKLKSVLYTMDYNVGEYISLSKSAIYNSNETYYIKSGLYVNYSRDIFNLPNKNNSQVIYYPTIIQNINYITAN